MSRGHAGESDNLKSAPTESMDENREYAGIEYGRGLGKVLQRPPRFAMTKNGMG